MPRPNNSNKPPKSFTQRAHPGGGGAAAGGGPGGIGAGPAPDPSNANTPPADGTPPKKSDPARNRFKKRPGKR